MEFTSMELRMIRNESYKMPARGKIQWSTDYWLEWKELVGIKTWYKENFYYGRKTIVKEIWEWDQRRQILKVSLIV